MADFYSMRIIEALRSGVPSRAIGEYFSESRPSMMKRILEPMEAVRETGRSDGLIFTGRYGEGKTHLLNTVFSMATSSNMVVTLLPLGKETPLNKLHVLYPKIISNTYLPNAHQPGFRQQLESLTSGSAVASELLAYSAKVLDTDKLYYLMSSFLKTQEDDERLTFLSDLEGDFATSAAIKRSYRRITGTVAKFNQGFRKTMHTTDYLYFMSHLFRQLGYDGWVILFDEAELIGRFGKKTRIKTYLEMDRFLNPDPRLESTYTLFAMSSSYVEDVIDKKNDFQIAEEVFQDDPESLKSVNQVLNQIIGAPELSPLTKDETLQILSQIQSFHAKAYDWTPSVTAETLYRETEGGGYLLRTRIRGAIEFLDQLYQYGEAGGTRITELGAERYDEIPDLTGMELV